MHWGRKAGWGLLLLALVVCGAAVLLLRNPSPGPASPPEKNGLPSSGPVASATGSGSPASTRSPGSSRIADSKIQDVLRAFLEHRPGALRDLKALEAELSAMDRAEAVAAIRRFLDSGQNAPTGQAFELGAGGSLASAPTIRLYLLDLLARLDPAQAAQVSRQILSQKTSPDEWAISMRNLGRADSSSSGYLAAKVSEMLSYAPWRSNPSAGYLEAFDIAVYTKSVNLMPQFLEMINSGQPGLDQAARVAVDRLAASSPADVLNYLSSNPSMLADKPYLRADFYAKADLNDSVQRSTIEAHLADPSVSIVEKDKIIAALAQDTEFISDNLLTPVNSSEERGSQRLQTLRRVGTDWLAKNRFPALSNSIREAIQ